MSIPITSWLRGFFALQARAMESRGFIELDAGEDTAVRWPRTTGADVITIAALVDPFVREREDTFAGANLARRWFAVTSDIGTFARVAPDAEYVANQAFWAVLPSICVFLHAEHAVLPPPAQLTALLDNLGKPAVPREVRYDHLYHAQYVYLRDKRGADELGAARPVPRSTNADALQLVAYWTTALGNVAHVEPAVAEQWKALFADIEADARRGEATALYPRNLILWRELQRAATYVSGGGTAPSGARSAIEGALAGLGTPLLIAAGLVRLLLVACKES